MTLLWGFLWGVAAVGTIAGGAILGVWWERKVSARIQMRYGPQQIGPYGSLQMIADVPKLLFKEDIVPDLADKAIFRFAPLFVFGPVAASHGRHPVRSRLGAARHERRHPVLPRRAVDRGHRDPAVGMGKPQHARCRSVASARPRR